MTNTFLHGVEVIELTSGARTISTPASAVIGLVGTAPSADPAAFPLDTPVLITSPSQAAALTKNLPDNPEASDYGSLPDAIAGIYAGAKTPVVIVRVDVTLTDPIATQLAAVVGVQADQTGCFALLAAQSLCGVKPKILIAPSWTHQDGAANTANPVCAALKTVAGRVRGIVVADGPNDTEAAAAAASTLVGNERLYLVDPWIKVSSITGAGIDTVPASADVAGVIANSDQQRGFWWSPSNQSLPRALGTGRAIEFSISDTDTESNLLNAAGIATVVNAGAGFLLWGNRTASTDSEWVFLSVRRTFDMIEDAVEMSYLWAMDRPFSAQLLTDVNNELNSYLRSLKARGAILGGTAWLDPDLNTANTMKAGQYYVDFDAEPPAPLERLTFQASRNDGYYDELVAAVSSAASN